jgi:short-subunit dehydrogenase
MDNQGKIALVTGASSGIGAATARRLAAEGFVVIMVARREDRLKALIDEIQAGGGSACHITADLTSESACQLVFDQVTATFGSADVVVNNAGFGWYGYGDELPWSLAKQMMAVNMAAIAQLTFLFLPEMKKRGRGHIINVGSIAGSLPSQGVALYSATKSFVDAFSTSLYREARGTGVHVSVVKPGPVTTPFFETVEERSNGRRIPIARFAVTPEKVADRIWGVIKRPKRITYVPRIMALAPWVELTMGWLMDLLGPLLLRRQTDSH